MSERLQDRLYPPIVTVTEAVFKLRRIPVTVTGSEHVPHEGGAVMAANHIGYLDFTFVGAAAKPAGRLVRFMAKREIFDNAVAGPIMRGMHHISVDREAGTQSYAEALRHLRAGEIVGLFPEGTTSRSFEPITFRPGATAMAAAAKVPLLPVAVWGSQRLWTKAHRTMVSLRQVPVLVAVGEPLHFERREDHEAATERVRQVITGMLHQLQDVYPDHPRDDDDRWWMPARLGGTAPTPAEAEIIEAARREAKASSEPTGP